ncbi:MAG: inositol monophosphatase [Sporocytophaga sp.]|uniref:inositol monophosphatase family protein n=1 Tax=Sporocytophaga sp. TaxID=2231183 RepID=UPI001AFFFAE1|nr:inositol monophosphatase family protein [Sporocytophaga sp.]MBO9698779.1 inositol monophosphatase [Sporocytophaga sp.]
MENSANYKENNVLALINLEEVCLKVIELTKEVLSFLKHEQEGFDRSKIEHKGKNDLVSYVDKQSEIMLVQGLKKILPEAGFITEEATISREERKYTWIIDPLDGTTNFLHNMPFYSISVGLMTEGRMILGVVHEVNLNECFYAWEGGGAYLNGKRIFVNPNTSLESSLLATGFRYKKLDKTDAYFEMINEFFKTTNGVRKLGSTAVDLAYVACGRLDGCFEFNLNSWDIAAGVLLVKEAGGIVTDFKGGNDFLSGKEVLACGKAYEEISKVVKQLWN